jgi:hypothetical protein
VVVVVVQFQELLEVLVVVVMAIHQIQTTLKVVLEFLGKVILVGLEIMDITVHMMAVAAVAAVGEVKVEKFLMAAPNTDILVELEVDMDLILPLLQI